MNTIRTPRAPLGLSSMMTPQIEDLLARTDSKFALVTLAARRARQINSYFNQLGDGLGSMVPPQVSSIARKPLSIAFEEIAADKIRQVFNEIVSHPDLKDLWGLLPPRFDPVNPPRTLASVLTDLERAQNPHLTSARLRANARRIAQALSEAGARQMTRSEITLLASELVSA